MPFVRLPSWWCAARLSCALGTALLSRAALKASQALRTVRYSTAMDMVRICPDLGPTDEARTAMADKAARDGLLHRRADKAASWAREEALRQMEELAASRPDLPEHEVKHGRGRLWRVLPASPTLALVRAADGSLESDPREQAEALAVHWAEVLPSKPMDKGQ